MTGIVFQAEVFAVIGSRQDLQASFHLVQGTSELSRRLSDKSTTCAIVRFDPFDSEAMTTLKEVCQAADPLRVPVFSFSLSNLNWIENLTAQLGATAHFNHFPNIEDIHHARTTIDDISADD